MTVPNHWRVRKAGRNVLSCRFDRGAKPSMAPRMADDLADHMKPPVEEVIGAGDDHHRQVQWLGPFEDIGQWHGGVFGSMDDNGVAWHGLGMVAACAFDEARSGADQHQSLCRMPGIEQRFGHPCQDVGAEGEAGEGDRQIAVTTLGFRQYRQQVLGFP